MKKNLVSTLVIALFLITYKLNAQLPVNYIFTQDSLDGFNEEKAIEMAVGKHLVDNEFKFFLNNAKREFVDHKYNIGHSHDIVWKTLQTATIQPACSNVDFENGTLSGWTVSNGGNSNSLTMSGCCSPGVGVASVINSIGNDPLFNTLSLVSPFGGNKIVKLNNATAGNKAQRISQTFNVTSSNAIFQIAYSGLLNSGGHDCFEQPYINISIKDSTGTVLSCPKIEIQAPDPNCIPTNSTSTLGWNYTGFDNSGGKVYWHNWDIKTVDLSPYIGSNITVQITVGSCIFSAHYGYGYFDCRCLPLEITLNNNIYDATPQIPINVSTCGSGSASINAPTGLGPYLWNGPAGSGVTGLTTQSMTVTTPGTYTLNMSPAGGCTAGGVTKYIILNVTPNPTVTNITAQATCTNATGSGTINVSSGSAPFNYNWIPAASTSSLGTGLSPGTNYTVNVVDTFGCKAATIVSIASFTDAPTYTISPLSANLTCFATSVTVTASTFSNTTAVWTHTTTSSFTATAPGTYSCVVTNTISSCTSTVPIIITTNTIVPVATYTKSCNAGVVSLNASSTSGVALGWLAPTSPPSPVSNPGSSSATGFYTLTATNLSTGCKSTYTVESIVPALTVLTSPSNQLTCTSPSVQSTASSSTSSATITWFDGVATSTTGTLPITTAGSYTATASLAGGCSTQSVITITTNTNVGANINAPTTVLSCVTTTITLTANQTSGGVYNYTWTPSAPTGTNNTFAVASPDTYSLSMINTTNGCTATALPIAITQNTILPTATYSVLCGTYPATLSATSSSGINLTWLSPTMPFATSVPNNGTSSASGIFTVTATNPSTGCKTTYTIQSLIPDVSITNNPAIYTLTCNNPTIQATAASSTSATQSVVITWLNGSSTANVLPITAAGNYTVDVQISGGCSTRSVVAIITNTAAGVAISSPSTIVSCATNSLPLAANVTTANPYTYVWLPSTPIYTNSIYNVSDAGTYTVIVMNTVNGCTASATQSVTHETVTASFIADPYQGLMPLPVTFSNTSSNALSYNWDLGNGNIYTTTNASTIYESQGNYSVVLTATNGFCVDTAVRIIKVELVSFFKVPNVFTPNGDGKNDIYTFDAVNMGEITFTVFDRWGLKMLETTSNGNVKWDGKNKGGSVINDGTYFYIIKAVGLDDVKYDLQGTITIFQ